MSSFMMDLIAPDLLSRTPVSPVSAEGELTRRVDTLTHCQVRDLKVVQHDDARVVVQGKANSYYVKQLVTHAIQELLPSVTVDNTIHVSTPNRSALARAIPTLPYL